MQAAFRTNDPIETDLALPESGPNELVRRRNWLITAIIDLLFLLPLVAFICFYDLNSPSIHYRDETTHVRAIQEMRLSHSFWTPTVRGKPYFNKPPFKMWLTSIPLEVFGESAFSYRFLDALTGVILTTLLYFFSRAMFRSRVAGLAAAFALILCPAYIFGHGVRKAVQDSMLILLDSVALMLGWKLLERLTEVPWRRGKTALAVGCGIAVGFAMLTKSAAGLLPLIIAGTYALVSGQALTLLRRDYKTLLCVLVPAFLIPSSYMLPHCLFTEGACQTMFGQEVIERASEGYHNTEERWFYFIRIFEDRQMIPPEILVPSVLFVVASWFVTRRPFLLFLMVWAAVPLTLFSFVPSRLTWYIAPAFPAFCLMFGETARASASALRRAFRPWWEGDERPTLASAVGTLFLVASVVLLTENAWSIGRALVFAKPRLITDRIVEDIVRNAEARPDKREVLYLDAPEPSLHESTYGGMIEPLVTRVSGIDEAVRLARTGRFAYVFSGIEEFPALVTSGIISAYRYLPPLYDRNRWLVVASLDPTVPARLLRKTSRVIDFGKDDVRGHFGLGELSKQASGSFQYGTPWLSLPIAGDSALKSLGAELRLSFAVRGASPVRLRISLNGVELLEKQTAQSDLKTLRVPVPPGVFQDGENAFQIRLTTLDGSEPDESAKLLLNWLIVDLGAAPHP